MKIPIKKHEFDLLSKRNAASESAIATAKAAGKIAQLERTSLEETVSCFSIGAGVPQEKEFAGFQFGQNEQGEYILELIEKSEVTNAA